ncbi:MAG: methyltransferase domain-containing protein [Actinomycetia bacterium]|nr:methyltransferase domain-containing protein [Actinomycetes bacterium]MCP4961433.1 methyltransferase domain-containing protein [Actinomycetes bacterium]
MTDTPAGLNLEALPDRLNLGCGWDHRDGYLNVDFQDYHNPDLVADVRDLSMLPSESFVEIIAQDVLEHLERRDTRPALTEWARLLKDGGTVVLRVPDIIGVARLIDREKSVEHHETMVHALFGTQAYSGDYHYVGFTELTLRKALHDTGFVVSDLRRKDEWLFDCVATKVADPGPFEPGPLPFVELAPIDPPPGVTETPVAEAEGQPGPGRVDQMVAAVAERLPASVRSAGQKAWRPLRACFARHFSQPHKTE